MTTVSVPITIDDPINHAILSVSEDRLSGFHPDPFGEIARLSGVALPLVFERIRAMLAAGTIRRVRQTVLTNRLAPGALVAWQIPEKRLHAAFDELFQRDPSSGHVVIRTADPSTPGARYRLWTTLKVPQGYSIEKHCDLLQSRIGAERYKLMPARKLFALGVGHLRRRNAEPGARQPQPAAVTDAEVIPLSEQDWRVLDALRRELTVEEVACKLWQRRAAEAGVDFDTFVEGVRALEARGIIGRFTTFLEHVKPLADGQRVTHYNALFHWRVPTGRELEAGREVGRHDIMTHAYWREGGPEFKDVNVMGVAHGLDKDLLLAHKAAIDTHLADAGIPVLYTNVFWGGRSEIKPSEISPVAYAAWCRAQGIDPATMRQHEDQQ